jgi:hypothetical protein
MVSRTGQDELLGDSRAEVRLVMNTITMSTMIVELMTS